MNEPLPPQGPGPGNPALDAFIRRKLQEKLNELGQTVSPEYMELAVKKYSSPGSVLRQQYFKEAADMAAQEAQKAQLGGSGLDMLHRTARDVGVGLVKGITSPLRAAGHVFDTEPAQSQYGIKEEAPASGLEGFLERQSSENKMGGRGLSPNPVVGTIQSAVEPASEMVGAMPLANQSMRLTGNALTNVASKVPQSRVLQTLGTLGRHEGMQGPAQAGALARIGEIARATPRAVVKGGVAGAVAMPDETFAHGEAGTNLAMGAGLSALDALAAAKVPGAKPSRLGPAIRDLFADPVQRAPLRDSPIIDIQKTAPEPIAAEIGADVPSPRPVEPAQAAAGAGTPASAKPMTGGESVDWVGLDIGQADQARKLFASLTDPRERARILGVEEQVLGAKKDPRIADNVINADSPEKLMGYLQKRLIKAASGKAPLYANKPSKRQAKLEPKAEAPSGSTTVRLTGRQQAIDDMRAETPGVETSSKAIAPIGEVKSPPAEIEAGAINQQAGITMENAAKRPVRAKRQDVLAQATRMEDGTLDWDQLSAPQREAVAGMLGKNYRGKILNMSMANVQKTLNNAQFESFLKALKRQPRAAAPEGAAPVAEAAAPSAADAAPVEVIPEGTKPSRRGTLNRAVTQAEPEVPAAPTVEAELAAKVDQMNVSPGWWDKQATPAQKADLIRTVVAQRQMPFDADVGAGMTFEQLPPFLRRGLPQQKTPAPVAEGGAPGKGANFPGKRRLAGKPKQAAPGRTP